MTQPNSYAKAASLVGQIDQHVRTGVLRGAALDRALRIADLYTRLAEVEVAQQQNELTRAMTRHPAAGKRNPAPKPAPRPAPSPALTVMRSNGAR